MNISIKIPEEFESHFNRDRFKDSLGRILFDLQEYKKEAGVVALSGKYEIETLEMLQDSLLNSKTYDFSVLKDSDELDDNIELHMVKKYELTDEKKNIDGHILHRIKRLSDGELGGWVESEDNLSQEGDSWIADEAKVYDNAKVYDSAQVYGNVSVYGNAQVFGRAQAYDDAQIYNDAQVYDNAEVYGEAWIYDDAQVYGDAKICDDAIVCNNAKVYGEAIVDSDRCIGGETEVFDNSCVDYVEIL